MQQYPQYPSVPPQPPAPPQKRRKWPIVLGSLLLGVAMFAGCTALVASSGDGSGTAISSPSTTAQAGADETTEPAADPTTEPAATPSPDGTFTGSCDYTLDPYQLIGDIDIENTGNVGMVVKVTISWPQLGYGPIKMHRQVKVGYGKSKTVRFHRPASMTEIDRLQSWQTNHGFADGCKYHGSMVDTFGSVHS